MPLLSSTTTRKRKRLSGNERKQIGLSDKKKSAWMRSDCRTCLFSNIEKEFSENLDFNNVVDTFAKMKNRRKQLVHVVCLLGLCIMYLQIKY